MGKGDETQRIMERRMGVALILFALVLGMAAVNDRVTEFGTLLAGDLKGSGTQYGFIAWVGAIIALAAVFKMLNLPEAGRAMVILIILAYLLGHGKIPSQIVQGIQGAGSGGGASK